MCTKISQTDKVNTQLNVPTQHPEIYISDKTSYRLPFAINPDCINPNLKSNEQFASKKIIYEITIGLLLSVGVEITGALIGSSLSG